MTPFIGPSYELRRKKADVQRSVNLMVTPVESGSGKNSVFLKSVPGLGVFSVLDGPPPASTEFISYTQLDSSTVPPVPAHLAGDRIIQIMYGQDTLTVGPSPGEPAAILGWSTVFFESENVDQSLRGMRIVEKIDADNSITSVGTGSFPQKGVVITRYGTLGDFATTPIDAGDNITLPNIATPAGSFVLWGIQTNQFYTYTIPPELTVLGDSRTPFSLGPTWINGLSSAVDYTAASKVLSGTGPAYHRAWAVVFYPG